MKAIPLSLAAQSLRIRVLPFATGIFLLILFLKPPTGPSGNMAQRTEMKFRAASAISGALLADAATMPLHWIYDPQKISNLTRDQDPAFFLTPSCPFYSTARFPGHYSLGQSSPYGEQMAAYVTFLVERNGSWDTMAFHSFYLDFLKHYGGRLDHASRGFLESGGKVAPDDAQANAFEKAPLAVALKAAGRISSVGPLLEKMIRSTQDNAQSVKYGLALGRALEAAVVPGATLEDCIEALTADGADHDVRRHVASAMAAKGLDANEWSASLNGILGCAFPGSFLMPVKIMIDSLDISTSQRFEWAIRRNIMVGGDQCSRAIFLGSLFAALDPASIPPQWRRAMSGYDEMFEKATLVAG